MAITEEKRAYLKKYRQTRKVHIAKVSHAKYLRTRDKCLRATKQWAKDNPERIKELDLEYYYRNHEKCKIRDKTRWVFGHLKNDAKCELCQNKGDIDFHHEEPYRYDVFRLLCKECHLSVENQKRENYACAKNGGKK